MLHLHLIAAAILRKRRRHLGVTPTPGRRLFMLPTREACNNVIKEWCRNAVAKESTWSCCRLSYSVLLQDANVNDATVAYLLGHTTTAQVQRTYKRHQPKNEMSAVSKLPAPAEIPKHLRSVEDIDFEVFLPVPIKPNRAVDAGNSEQGFSNPQLESDDEEWIEL